MHEFAVQVRRDHVRKHTLFTCHDARAHTLVTCHINTHALVTCHKVGARALATRNDVRKHALVVHHTTFVHKWMRIIHANQVTRCAHVKGVELRKIAIDYCCRGFLRQILENSQYFGNLDAMVVLAVRNNAFLLAWFDWRQAVWQTFLWRIKFHHWNSTGTLAYWCNPFSGQFGKLKWNTKIRRMPVLNDIISMVALNGLFGKYGLVSISCVKTAIYIQSQGIR